MKICSLHANYAVNALALVIHSVEDIIHVTVLVTEYSTDLQIKYDPPAGEHRLVKFLIKMWIINKR